MESKKTLTDEQRAAATLSVEVPTDIITNPKGPRRLEKMQGLAIGPLAAEQKILLRRLVSEYVDNLEIGKREDYWKKFEAGCEQRFWRRPSASALLCGRSPLTS